MRSKNNLSNARKELSSRGPCAFKLGDQINGHANGME